MKVVPHIFFGHPALQTLFMQGNAAIFFKQIQAETGNNERYVAAHALTQVLSGILQVEDHAGNFVQVRAGEMVFLPKGIYFVSDILPEEGAFEALVSFFPEQMMEEWVDQWGAASMESLEGIGDFPQAQVTSPQIGQVEETALPLVFPLPERIQRYSQSLLDIYLPAHPQNFPLTESKLRELLHLLGSSTVGPLLAKAVLQLSQRQKRNLGSFMQSNFSKPLGVEDYAYLSGRSLSSFHRDFKRQFGQAPKQWLIQRRLEKAFSLLKTESRSVSEVAAEVGYEDVSHFSKAFRKAYGLPPKQFAIQQRQS